MLTTLQMFGGTNWGNLGYDSGYTSYDYAAVRVHSSRLGVFHAYNHRQLQRTGQSPEENTQNSSCLPTSSRSLPDIFQQPHRLIIHKECLFPTPGLPSLISQAKMGAFTLFDMPTLGATGRYPLTLRSQHPGDTKQFLFMILNN